MRIRDKLVLGTAVGAGLIWGARVLRRRQRRISLHDRVVVITGASSGHGLILARLAAQKHAHLVIAARSLDDLTRAEPELLREGALSVLSVETDVSDEAQAKRLIDRAVEKHGRVDVLINNAGTIQVGPAEAMTRDDFEKALATNFWGSVNTCLAVLPHMKAEGFGRIGNVVSLGGKVAVPHLLPYSASKFALTGFTEGLRAEVARDNIYVTAVYPATMRTGGHSHAWFKGNRQAEFGWFSVSDSLPVLSVSAETVAERFLEGVLDGDAEVLVGWPTFVAVLMNNLFPEETAELSAMVNRWLLPTGDGEPNEAIQGQDLPGTLPRAMNRAVPASARVS